MGGKLVQNSLNVKWTVLTSQERKCTRSLIGRQKSRSRNKINIYDVITEVNNWTTLSGKDRRDTLGNLPPLKVDGQIDLYPYSTTRVEFKGPITILNLQWRLRGFKSLRVTVLK